MENQKSINCSSGGGGGGGDGEALKCKAKVKLMCSYGGKIQPRQRDNQLAYVGGDTKIVTVDRKIRFSEISLKLSSLCNCGEVCIKYQLPGEDLDALVTLIDDDDVEHMMVEYDRMHKGSAKPARLRLFLFNPNRPAKPDSEAPLNPDFLFGFDKDYQPSITPTSHDLLQLQIPGGMSVPENPGPETHKENGAVPGNSGSGNKLMLLQTHLPPHLHQGHVTSGVVYANGMKMVYGLPMMASGFHTAVGQFGVVAGGDKNQEQPVYNFFPAMPTVPVPEQKPALVSTGEIPNYSVNGDHPTA
nr:Phox/Bem1p protein [Ipomoea batatas]